GRRPTPRLVLWHFNLRPAWASPSPPPGAQFPARHARAQIMKWFPTCSGPDGPLLIPPCERAVPTEGPQGESYISVDQIYRSLRIPRPRHRLVRYAPGRRSLCPHAGLRHHLGLARSGCAGTSTRRGGKTLSATVLWPP